MAMNKIVHTLRELVGEANTRKILDARGGQEVYIPIPDNLTPDHWLVETLGRELAMTVCGRFQKERLSLPMGHAAGTRNALHRKVVDMSLEGRSVNLIVEATGLHARTIRRLRTRYLG
ncbi:hypothetical protein C4J81_03665 [Deltaproteobacteria bacterium Smac51]|nr:hypothetical protein C4J81_03665 [Deltaproteobacteria bacterium Smac51]